MSGLINLIKNLFSGIFGFLGGLFSKKSTASTEPVKAKGKKSAGYFLEAEEAAGVSAAPKATAKADTPSVVESAKAPEPAAAAKALNLPQPTITTFAPNYLLPTSTNGRRRPGANMASFLDMAKQTKVSS